MVKCLLVRKCSSLTARYSNSSGATMVEFAIFFPVVMLCFAFILFMGHIYAASATLEVAVGGVRPGYTRGNLDDDIIASIDSFKSNALAAPPPALRNLLASPDKQATAFGAGGIYTDLFNGLHGVYGAGYQTAAGVRLWHVHRSTLYAMVYALNIARANLGGSVKFPCAVNNNAEMKFTEPGCLACLPIPNPSHGPPLGPIPEPSPWFITAADPYTGIVCRFRPHGYLLEPVSWVFSAIQGVGGPDNIFTMQITRRAVIADYHGFVGEEFFRF